MQHNAAVEPKLLLAATPIGNIGDASDRLKRALEGADIIAAEDTRKAHTLMSNLNITFTAKVISYFDGNEQDRVPFLIDALREGKSVVVISDAGMPTVSDPGYRIAHAATAAGIPFSVLPGPSAVTTALALSGLPSDRFSFEGFLPRKQGERLHFLNDLATERRTMIFFEAPHRIVDTVADLISVFGENRPAAMCREITKTYEEVTRGTLADIQARCEREVLGEITLVISGLTEVVEMTDEAIAETVSTLIEQGVDRKAAIAEVVSRYGIPKRRVFDVMVAVKKSSTN